MFVISESSRDADASRGETKKKKKKTERRARRRSSSFLVDVGGRDPRASLGFRVGAKPYDEPLPPRARRTFVSHLKSLYFSVRRRSPSSHCARW
jgi:hypothetical protein